MGEWFDYRITFANRDGNLSQELIDKGVVSVEKSGLHVCLKSLDGETLQTRHYPDNGSDSIIIQKSKKAITYYNRWVPYPALHIAISKNFPDDVLKIKRTDSGGEEDLVFYEKDGVVCTKDGEREIIDCLAGVNPQMLKKVKDNYLVSIPINQGADKWGSFSVPKDNVVFLTAADMIDGTPCGRGHAVFLHTDTIEVTFKSGKKTMDVKDLVKQYYTAKNEYYKEMHEPAIIEGLPASAFTDKEGFFVVKIPCHTNVSASGVISLTVGEYAVDTITGNVNIGFKGKRHNTMIALPGGKIVKKELKNGFIQKCYEDYLRLNKEDLER